MSLLELQASMTITRPGRDGDRVDPLKPASAFTDTISGGPSPMASMTSTDGSKATLGVACAVCCAVPMLVVTGALSLATIAAFGVGAGSIVAVAGATWAFWSERLPVLAPTGRVAIASAGVASTGSGLIVADLSSTTGRSLFVGGVALLAVAALLALSSSQAQLARQAQ